MAKIGLAFGGAVVGFLLGGPLGAQIGFAIGGVLGSVLFPGKLPPGPRVNDLVVTSATNGAAIPIVYNTQRIAGNIIWAPPIIESSTKKSVKGGPKQVTYSYTANFAVAFCEGQGGSTVGSGTDPSYLDFAASSSGNTGSGPSGTAIDSVATSIPGDLVLSYRMESNSNPPIFTTPWTPIALNLNAIGRLGYLKTSLTDLPAPVSDSYTVFGTQAWAMMMASFGSVGTPVFVTRASGNNTTPFNITPITLTAGICIIAFIEAASNGSDPIGFTVSDSLGNNWIFIGTGAGTRNGPGGQLAQVSMYACFNSIGGTGTISLGGNSSATSATWTILEVSGLVGIRAQSPATVGRIWFDSKVVYDPSSGSAAITAISEAGNVVTVTSTLNPAIGAQVTIAGAPTNYNGKFKVLLSSPVNFTYYNPKSSLAPGSGGTATIAPPKYPKPTIYSGSESQAADPTMQGAVGAANCPAFRGLLYAVWANFPLADFGNRIPNVRGEITIPAANGGPQALSAIVTDIATRCGLASTDIDVTQLINNPASSPVIPVPAPIGYVITRPSTGQSVLKPLALAFFFDAVESGGIIRFVPRGQAAASLTVPESDLGWQKDNFKLTEQIGMLQDVPREFEVLFNDKALDYQQNKGHKRRHTRIVHTKQQTVIELPMTLDSTTARQIAEKALFLAYLERKPFDMNLWKVLYLLYDPTDVIQFVYEGLTFQLRIVKLQIGVDFTVALSGVNENASGYLSSIVGSSGTGVVPAQNRTLPDTVLFLFDIPLLRDVDANTSGSGYYFAMSAISPATWPGASLQKSSDNVNFSEETTSSVAANYGVASNILGPPRSPWTWDTINTLTVFMTNGILAGTSDLNVLNGANALLYGNELIQYVNAVQNADGSFTISRLLRGRRGTEVYCGTHSVNEAVVDLVAPGVIRRAVSTSNLQVIRYFRPVTFGADISTITSQLMTDTGQDLFPYASASLAGTRDGSNNLTLSWIRRTRIGGDWLNGIGVVPLSEGSESYDVEILLNGNVVRTFAGLSSPTVVYTAAQQITDFGGSVPPSVTFNVYQNSASIGRGFKATGIV